MITAFQSGAFQQSAFQIEEEMTIYHPRVGFELISVAATGSDRASAATANLTLHQTVLLLSSSGGVVFSGAEAGMRVIFPITTSAVGSIMIYLQSGDSLYGTSTDSFSAGTYAPHLGDTVEMLKINATEWLIVTSS